jgi:hypothetical protein
MPTLSTGTLLSPWLVLPLAAVTMLAIAGHVLSLYAEEMPASRRRIRAANGMLMLFVAALLAYALGVAPVATPPYATAHQTHTFLLVWMTIIGLLPIVVMLAALDVLNTVLLHVMARRRLRRQLGQDLHAVRRERAGGAGSV